MRQAERIAAGSIVVGLAVLSLKMAAWWITGSAALFSDAAETVVNVAVGAGSAFFALRLSAVPADENHPYGHSKVEFISAVIAGVLIVLAALEILRYALGSLASPRAAHDAAARHGAERAGDVDEPGLGAAAVPAPVGGSARRR